MSDTESAVAQDPLNSMADALEAAARAVKDGARHAQEAAANLLPESGSMLSQVAYKACYAISYGLVFPSALIAQSIPQNNAFVHGFVDGAHAAKDMVSELKSKKEGVDPTIV